LLDQVLVLLGLSGRHVALLLLLWLALHHILDGPSLKRHVGLGLRLHLGGFGLFQ
jgi:hypothetical protein